MAHPFEKMFDKALKKSTTSENEVLVVAEKLREKGYRVEEIHGVLSKLHKSLIDPTEALIVGEAKEEFSRHLPDFDDED
jgi:hypothetical protein